jgi:hypothetical protein
MKIVLGKLTVHEVVPMLREPNQPTERTNRRLRSSHVLSGRCDEGSYANYQEGR